MSELHEAEGSAPAPEDEPIVTPGDEPEPEPEPEPADDDADEPEPEPEPEPQITEREIEKQMGALEKEAARHAERIRSIMGEAADSLVPCARCAGPFPGFHFPVEQAPLEQERLAAVFVDLGFAPPDVYPDDSYARRCEACDGYGKVSSGSRVTDQLALRCVPCKGLGWVPVGSQRVSGAATVQNGPEPTNVNAPREPNPDADLWGRLVGDPHYGVHPMYVTE